MNGMQQKREPLLPFAWIGADQRGLMLAPRVEQEACPGFDRRTQLQAIQQASHGPEVSGPGGVADVRIEGMKIERECDAAVAQLGQDLEGIFQPMVGEPVGVVPEQHAEPLRRRVRPPRQRGCRRGLDLPPPAVKLIAGFRCRSGGIGRRARLRALHLSPAEPENHILSSFSSQGLTAKRTRVATFRPCCVVTILCPCPSVTL